MRLMAIIGDEDKDGEDDDDDTVGIFKDVIAAVVVAVAP
jgi:hypothetical protein